MERNKERIDKAKSFIKKTCNISTSQMSKTYNNSSTISYSDSIWEDIENEDENHITSSKDPKELGKMVKRLLRVWRVSELIIRGEYIHPDHYIVS